MSRHIDPPRVAGQISRTKSRVYDLERRLMGRQPAQQECCGESQIEARVFPNANMMQSDPEEAPEDAQFFETQPLSFSIESRYQRVRLNVSFNVNALADVTGDLWVVFTIYLNDGSTEYEMSGSFFSASTYKASADPAGNVGLHVNMTTTEDIPRGGWQMYAVGEVYITTPDGMGGVDRVSAEPLFGAGVSVDAVFGQKLSAQELWSVYVPPS